MKITKGRDTKIYIELDSAEVKENTLLITADSLTEQSILESLECYLNNVNLDHEELLLFLDTKLGKAYTQ